MQLGCSQLGKDFEYTLDTLAGFAANPNIYATVLVSLGCENAQLNLVKKEIEKRTNKPMESVIIQEEGGTLKAIEKATRYAKEFAAEASMLRREEVPISELIMGTECGGSDPTSGLASNVLIGNLSDKMVENGGTTVLSETTEFIGAEHILARRAKNDEVKKRIYDIVHRFEDHIIKNTGEEVREGNPSPGNKEGGLTTLEEKSLGCIHKGGTTTVNGVYDYSKQLETKKA
ncbi:MAG: UxaA family hydrolase [Anaerococcus obesiensis]